MQVTIGLRNMEIPAGVTISIVERFMHYILHELFDKQPTLYFTSFVLPAIQGGALLHSGVLVALTNCTFESNMAGEDGLAVMSFGLVNNIRDLTFRKNSFFCASGKYGLDKDIDEVEV